MMIRFLFAAALAFSMALASAAMADNRMGPNRVPTSDGQIKLTFAPIVKRVSPAVVNVYAKRIERQSEGALSSDPFFRRFFGQSVPGRTQERVQNSLGSGVIVDQRGYIITNNHVISDGVDIRVALSDRREFEAKLLLADERTDLAVLKIDAGDEDLPVLPLADSDNLEVGDLVLAIGNPFGVGQTVTSGIVSALARTQVGVTDYQFFIQTDAAINPGNSGGALVDMAGQLVGINTAIFSRSGGSIGIGFSIPSNMVETVVRSAESGSAKISRPWLGVELQDVTADIADSLGFARPEGTLVAKLHPLSPLLAAGIQRGDVIVAIDGKAVESAREFGFRVGTARIGETRIVEYRRGEDSIETRVKLIAAPENVPRDLTTIRGNAPLAGLVLANLSPAVAEEIGLTADAQGVVVVNVTPGPAETFFKKGDTFIEINGQQIHKVADVRDVLKQPQPRWLIRLQRGEQKLRLQIGR